MLIRSAPPPTHSVDRLAVSPAEAARIAGIGRTKLYEAMASGALISFKFGSRRLIRIVEIEAWLRRLEASTKALA